MTHSLPSGITQGLLEHTWGGGWEQAEQLPLKKDVTARLSLRTSVRDGRDGPLGLLTLQGPAQAQGPEKRSNATENDELGGAVEGGLPLQKAEWYKPGTALGA